MDSYKLAPVFAVRNAVDITRDGVTIAKMISSGNPEADRAVLEELVEKANR